MNFLIECCKKYYYLNAKLKKDKSFATSDYHNLNEITKNMIQAFYELGVEDDYSFIIEKFKRRYISYESNIENNESKQEKNGIGKVYDYICNFDIQKDSFNIFINSLKIHQLLYSNFKGKEFGGGIRNTNVVLYDSDIEILDPISARERFNSYISISDELMKKIDKENIIQYIKECLVIMVDLIKTQPFADGNKRAFRSLYNLMLKRKKLPPVYIGKDEEDNFKNGLLKAMGENDYTLLTDLYLKLICDSIVSVLLQKEKIEFINETNKKI